MNINSNFQNHSKIFLLKEWFVIQHLKIKQENGFFQKTLLKKTILFLPLLALIACGPNAVGFLTKIKADLKTQEDPITNVEEIKAEAIASVQNPHTQ